LAADNSWIGPSAGSWGIASNWSAGLPQPADTVFIDGNRPQNSLVTLDFNATVSTLNISANDRLGVRGSSNSQGARLLVTGGSIVNAGTLALERPGSVQPGRLEIGPADATLGGGGFVRLDFGGIAGSGRLTNLDNTIRGFGSIGAVSAGMLNFGTVIVDMPNSLSGMFSGTTVPLQNRGVMRATDQAGLWLTGQVGKIYDNAGGRMEAELAGQVALDRGATIVGGTLATSNFGQFVVLANETGSIQDVQNSAEWELQNGSRLGLGGTIANTGQIQVGVFGPGALDCGDATVTLLGSGRITMGAAASLTGTGTLVLDGNLVRGAGLLGTNTLAVRTHGAGAIDATSSGQILLVDPAPAGGLDNAGTLRASATGSTLQLSGNGGGAFTNSGVIDAAGGTIKFTNGAVLTNLVGSTLTGGTWTMSNGGRIDLGAGATITQNAATIRFTSGGDNFPALASLRVNSGILSLNQNAQYNNNGSLDNLGTIDIGRGSSLFPLGDFNAGPDSTLAFGIAGVGASNFGDLFASGVARLDGALAVSLLDGFVPARGSTFRIVSAASVLGTFSSLEFPPLQNGLAFDVQYGSSTVTIRVVPEPAMIGMAIVTLGALMTRVVARRAPRRAS
jgi:hypothetical protein